MGDQREEVSASWDIDAAIVRHGGSACRRAACRAERRVTMSASCSLLNRA
jgi:hypothetical protein